jgi:soluble lytic murein transglycosylase-like protein
VVRDALHFVNRHRVLSVISLVLLLHLFVPSFAGTSRADYYRLRFLYQRMQMFYPWLNESLFRIIHAESHTAGVDYRVVCAIIDAESHGVRDAVSTSGAIGYMQVMPFNYRGDPRNLFISRINIRAGIRVFKVYYMLARGQLVIALKNYNSGPNSDFFNVPYIARVVDSVGKTQMPEDPVHPCW